MKNLLLILISLCALSLQAQRISEAQYVRLLNDEWKGKMEYTVTSGRVDILTDEYAIEVERASKWKQAIGQALWYGLQTERKPGIILIVENNEEYKYFLQLNSVLQHAGLTEQITVWQYPDDFPELAARQNDFFNTELTADKAFWLTDGSKVRHNSSCRYFKATRGRACTTEEGTACRRCGG